MKTIVLDRETAAGWGPSRLRAAHCSLAVLLLVSSLACAATQPVSPSPASSATPAAITPLMRELTNTVWHSLAPVAGTEATAPGWSLTPLAGQAYTLAFAVPDALPVSFQLSLLTGQHPMAPVIPVVPRTAAAADEVVVAGIALDPRGLPLTRGTVQLTTPFGEPGRAERVELDAFGCFVWRKRVATPAPPEGIAMLKAAGWTPGGWTVETPGVTQVLLAPGRALAVVLQGAAARPSRPPRWRWEAPHLTVTLEDRLERADEVVLERVGAPAGGGIHPDRVGDSLGELTFTLPAETSFAPLAWRLNILGEAVPLE